MRRTMIGITGVAALAAVVTLFGQPGNPTLGTWKLNLAKSKYDPANLAPKSMTTKMEPVGTKTRNTTTGIDYKGKAISYTYTVVFDGADYPVTGTGVPSGGDTISVKRANPNTVESTFKEGWEGRADKPLSLHKHDAHDHVDGHERQRATDAQYRRLR